MNCLKSIRPKEYMYFLKGLIVQKNGKFEKHKSNAIAFAWFIWEVCYKGITELKWIE